MYGIIVTGHGRFAEGLLEAAELILGKQTNIEAINFLKEESSVDLRDKIENAVNSMKGLEGIIFLTDLAGGTPFNTSVILSEEINSCKVLGGTNLPLLIEILMNRELGEITELIEAGLSVGKDAIVAFEKQESRMEKQKDRGI